jgi:hypothetical protein
MPGLIVDVVRCLIVDRVDDYMLTSIKPPYGIAPELQRSIAKYISIHDFLGWEKVTGGLQYFLVTQ